MGTKEEAQGTLSSTDFGVAASAFILNWNTVCSSFPPWTWVLSHHQVEGYLSLENVLLSSTQEEHSELSFPEAGKHSHQEDPIDVDDATLVHTNPCKVHYYDLHIIYCNSYRVPVLYFRAYDSDGEPLEFDEIEKDLPAYSKKALSDSKWTFITQEMAPSALIKTEWRVRSWFEISQVIL
ncbi:hypothetical protein RGQ29_031215 [Quercus rubra]|uniref:Ubiquitin-like-conjugating enzyme ATG10 n=1 Tax=Quercus rubra TaxID=3512 RepID=A0AAN7EK62_QUERU|nr:hypothetical protein RGQ29_031215 [Quercus rubra]